MSRATRRARLLVIDDEPALARIIARSLADVYDADVVTSAPDALARLRHGERYDAVLCDLLMPEMSGMELYATLSAERPDLARKMVFMTGGVASESAHEFLTSVENPSLDKPFTAADLHAILRTVVTR